MLITLVNDTLTRPKPDEATAATEKVNIIFNVIKKRWRKGVEEGKERKEKKRKRKKRLTRQERQQQQQPDSINLPDYLSHTHKDGGGCF